MFARGGSGQVARTRLMGLPGRVLLSPRVPQLPVIAGLVLPPPVRDRMSRKKISTTIYVTPEQSERLRLLHERTKVPVAVYIREGIDLVLRQYTHLLPGQLPLGAELAVTPSPPSTEPKPSTARPERDRAGSGAAEAGSELAAGAAGSKS